MFVFNFATLDQFGQVQNTGFPVQERERRERDADEDDQPRD